MVDYLAPLWLLRHSIITCVQVGLDRPTTEVYRNLMMMIPEGNSGAIAAYSTIDEVVAQVNTYVQEWLQYQALWDLQPDHLYGQLGEDVARSVSGTQVPVTRHEAVPYAL